ncbi:MAG: UMP kinase [Candidatus Roizmanbacteria bacterium]|nr:UMP kinase [Candidatus Roizmanbacteria bacterium]
MKETIVMSVGGSLIVPESGVNVSFLTKLNSFIRKNSTRNRRFILVAGGGTTARNYINGGRGVVHKITNDDLDWLGIHSTRLNAHLLRTIFRDIAHPRIIENYERKIFNPNESVIIAGGWKPGWSTDYCAALLAKDYNAHLIVNLSNIYYVFNKDPKKFPDAIRIEKTTWDYYETLVGTKWTPGLSTPFDPIASQLAKKAGLSVIVTKGDDFANLQHLIDGDPFKGSVITPFEVTPAFYDRNYYLGKQMVGKSRLHESKNMLVQAARFLAAWYRAFYIRFQYNPKRVLDVGCGTGLLVRALRKLGVDAWGLEISDDALLLAPKDIKPFILRGDITKLPFEDKEFDMVVTFNVLEHIERSKLHHTAEEVNRVARKYVLHKLYTPDNVLFAALNGRDVSRLSVYNKGFWNELFSSLPNSRILERNFHLPRAIETVYLLEKKK